MAKISHGKKPREILFIDQLLIYLSLFPVACSGFDVAGLLKYGDHQGRIGRAEIEICKPQRRAAAFILPLEILSAGTVGVLNGRCAEGFGEAFARGCGHKHRLRARPCRAQAVRGTSPKTACRFRQTAHQICRSSLRTARCPPINNSYMRKALSRGFR